MWKQSATARWLPLQAIAELCAVDAQQQEAALTGKVYLRGFDDLGRVRKMNEAVAAIDFGAAKYSRARLLSTAGQDKFYKLSSLYGRLSGR